ncbi:MAG: hypothetical protein COB50_03950 [Thiotrichales bacterium]|nr:MAG: hypothetical protein COB50_03950 [Thiotrichales bacterium]
MTIISNQFSNTNRNNPLSSSKNNIFNFANLLYNQLSPYAHTNSTALELRHDIKSNNMLNDRSSSPRAQASLGKTLVTMLEKSLDMISMVSPHAAMVANIIRTALPILQKLIAKLSAMFTPRPTPGE